MKQSNLQAYASTAVSFLLSKLGEEIRHIEKILLYGSVAKGEAQKESDVDLFVDTQSKKLPDKVRSILEEFPKSREAALFKLKGVENLLSVKVGELRNWTDLQQSIAASGIVLWGKYEPASRLGGRPHLLFWWEGIGKNRGAFLNKLYGFSLRSKRYVGMVKQIGGKKIGKSCIIIPSTEKERILVLLKKYKVKARQMEVVIP